MGLLVPSLLAEAPAMRRARQLLSPGLHLPSSYPTDGPDKLSFPPNQGPSKLGSEFIVDSRKRVIAPPGPWGPKEEGWVKRELGLSVFRSVLSVLFLAAMNSSICPLLSSPKRVTERLRNQTVCGNPSPAAL